MSEQEAAESAVGNERESSRIIVTSVPPGEKHTVLTGDRPTGALHLGHLYGSLRARVACQERFTQFILIADVQALTDNADNTEKVRNSVLEVMLDYLAVGIDPNKSTIYLQSQIPETSELTLYLMNLINLGRLQRNPTVKNEIQQKGYGNEIPVGFLCYPINQAADISQFKATLVPVGLDQVPMIEVCNDLTRAFNRTYKTELLVPAKALVSNSKALLPGTDGNPKMGKSLGNAIYIGDPENVVEKKVKGMFTDPGHLKVEDPGKVEGNPVFTYLEAFDPDRNQYLELAAHYQRGGLGDGVVKKRLATVLNEMLTPIRNRRAEYAKDPGEVMNILKKGTEKARAVVAQTMSEVRRAMGIQYF